MQYVGVMSSFEVKERTKKAAFFVAVKSLDNSLIVMMNISWVHRSSCVPCSYTFTVYHGGAFIVVVGPSDAPASRQKNYRDVEQTSFTANATLVRGSMGHRSHRSVGNPIRAFVQVNVVSSFCTGAVPLSLFSAFQFLNHELLTRGEYGIGAHRRNTTHSLLLVLVCATQRGRRTGDTAAAAAVVVVARRTIVTDIRVSFFT